MTDVRDLMTEVRIQRKDGERVRGWEGETERR